MSFIRYYKPFMHENAIFFFAFDIDFVSFSPDILPLTTSSGESFSLCFVLTACLLNFTTTLVDVSNFIGTLGYNSVS